MKRWMTVTAAGLSVLFLFGCKATDRPAGAPQPETDKIQIIGQLETPVPTESTAQTSGTDETTGDVTPEPSLTPAPTAAPTETPTPTEAPTPVLTEAPTPEPITVPTPEPTAGEKSEPEQTKAEAFCAIAESFLDTPYHRGGTSPESGFDPGGFVYYCLNQVGVKIRHKTSKGYSENENWTRIDSMDDLEPGDLCFFITPGNESVNCVTIYLGDGQMIYPSSGEGKVITNRIKSNYWVDAFVFARRVF